MHVSELCLGTHSFGWKTSPETSYALLDAYREAGGNFIQASAVCPDFPMSSDWSGLPETHVGQWMNDRAVRRSDLVIATRLTLCRPVSDVRSVSRLIRAACEGSLRRFGVAHLDLLFLEWSDGLLPIDEIFAAVGMLVREGMLRYGAVSGFPSWRVADVIGLSILSGAHMHICPRIVELLREQGLDDVLVVVGGIIPDTDLPKLNELGIAGIFPPGTAMQDIVEYITSHARDRAAV